LSELRERALLSLLKGVEARVEESHHLFEEEEDRKSVV
jgi:hypothetical protein